MKLSTYFSQDNLRMRAIRGAILSSGNIVGQNLIRLISNLILTRLLFPEAFGLMALVQVVMMGAGMFSDLGLRAAIVQDDRGNDPAFLNTAWTLQICRGFILCLAILAASGPIAEFYEEPMLKSLLTFTAFIPVIQGFNSTKIALADREIALGRLTVITLVSQFIGVVIMSILAWILQSVWALVIGTAISAVIMVFLSHYALPGVDNRITFEKAAARKLVKFGKFVFLATAATFVLNQGDRAVLGKFVELEDLAVFNIGIFLATAPLLLATAVNTQVLFALYARKPPSESEENRQKISKARNMMTLAIVAATAFLALIGDWLVRLLYDVRYEAAGPILVVMAISTLPRIVTMSYERIPLASGHSGVFAFFIVTRAVLQLPLLIWCVQTYGVLGAIIAPTVTWVLTYPLQIYLLRAYKGWDPKHDFIFLSLTAGLTALIVYIHYDTISVLW